MVINATVASLAADGDDKAGAEDSDLIVVVGVLLVVVDELSNTRSPGGAVTAAEQHVV